MKSKLLVFALLASLSVSASAKNQQTDAIDFEKVNQVLSTVGSSLIEGDTLFTSLGAQIDPVNTDLEKQQIKGTVSASVNNTIWAPSETSVFVSGAYTNLAQVDSNDQTTPSKVEISGILNTPVIALVQYGLGVYNCESSDQNNTASAYRYVESKVCPLLNERVPTLETTNDLLDLIQQSVDLINSSLSDYVALITKKISESQDPNEKENLQALLSSALQYQDVMNRLVMTRESSTLNFTFVWEKTLDYAVETTATLEISGSALNVGALFLTDFSKEHVDHYFSAMKEIFNGLQNEDKEMIDNLKSTFGEYLDMVRSIISG